MQKQSEYLACDCRKCADPSITSQKMNKETNSLYILKNELPEGGTLIDCISFRGGNDRR